MERNYIYLKVDYQLVKIQITDILYIEGLKDYVKIYLKNQDKPMLTLISLKNLEEKLSASGFIRIHRSFIVAGSAVTAIAKNTLQIGELTIPVTEQYKQAFSEFIKDWV